MKKIILTVALLVILIALCCVGFLLKRPKQINKQSIDYLNIDTSQSISWNLSDNDIVDLNQDLKSTKEIESLIYKYECEELKDLCDKNNLAVEMELSSVDLNGDGVEEYIALPWEVSGNWLRGASAGGDILIIKQDNNNGLVVMASFVGNSYSVLNSKTNGYYKILVHNHSSSTSGTETIYAKDNANFSYEGFEYVEQITKWYRHYD